VVGRVAGGLAPVGREEDGVVHTANSAAGVK
jgi:hypothetical protein